MRDGRFYPGPRARAHRRLPRAPGRPLRRGRRRAQSTRTGKPILTATELAVADPDNAGSGGRPRHRAALLPVGNRAVTALGHLYRYARHRRRRRAGAIVAVTATEPRRRRRSPCSSRAGARAGAGAVRPLALRRRPHGARRHVDAAHRRWPPPATGARAAALTTPLLSFRRVPGLIGARPQPERLPGSRSQAFADTLDATSCVVGRRSTACPSAQPQRRPAGDPGEQPEAARSAPSRSTALGADYTFTTDVRGGAAPAGGVVAGDLYLVGGGDPLLTSRRLSAAPTITIHGDQRRRRSTRSPTRSWPPASPRCRAARRRRLALRRRVLPRRRGATTSAPSRPGRSTRCSSTTPASRTAAARGRSPTTPTPAPASELTQLLARTGRVDRRRREHRHRAEQRHRRGEHRQSAPLPGRRRRDADHQRQQHRRDAGQGAGRALGRRRQHATPASRR